MVDSKSGYNLSGTVGWATGLIGNQAQFSGTQNLQTSGHTLGNLVNYTD